MNQSRPQPRFHSRAVFCFAALLLSLSLLLGCGVIDVIGGGLVPESATEADLRGQGLTPEQLKALANSTQLVRLDIRDNPVTLGDFTALSAALPGCEILWSVPIGDVTFSSDATELTLPAVDGASLELLKYFPNLTRVDATACSCYDELVAVSQSMPDCAFLWNVNLAGRAVSSGETTLDLSGASVTAAELTAALPYLPALTGVDLHDTGLDGNALSELITAFPNIRFEGDLDICGVMVDLAATDLDLTAATDYDLEAIIARLAFFPDAQTVDVSGLSTSPEDILRLREAYPDIAFAYDAELAGVTLSTKDTEVDLTGQSIGDLSAFAAQLEQLPALQRVNMVDCGLSDEQMAALSVQFPNIKFIWYVTVGRWQVRTDAPAFSTGNEHSTETVRYLKSGVTNLTTEDIAPLKYCTELVALDLGHKRRIKDISIVENMPKLRFLIVAMEGITDISPIAACTELEYLETFQNNLTDLSPLLSLKKLTHLNCSTNAIGSIDVLEQMTQLQRLWCIRCGLDKAQLAQLQESLPDCVINATGTHSTSNGWRNNDLYKEMQGLFGLPVLE